MTTNEPLDTFARRVKYLLDNSDLSKLTLTEQAEKLTISKSLLSQWLRGETVKTASYEKASAVCAVLNARVEWLLKNEPPMRPPITTPPADPMRGGSQVGIEEMNLEQHRDIMSQLFSNIPATARARIIKEALREALANKWIDRIPDEVLANWSAHEKIDALQNRSKSKQKA